MSTLQTIETFAEVASQLSFAKAARRLGLPPSTVTSRVRALEDSLGVRLLERTTRRVALTPEGSVFLERCRAGLAEIEAARTLVSTTGSAEGTVRISVPSAFPKARLAGLCRRFLDLHPRVSLDVTVSDEPADFLRDAVDVALRGNRPGSSGVIARLLSRTPVVLAAPPGRAGDHSLPILGPLARHLSSAPQPGRVYCHSLELAHELVLAGLARACLPEPLCTASAARGDLELGPLPEGVPESLALYLVYQDRRHLPQRVRLLMDFLTGELAA
ncbi:LysR family transcriptional regulator [Leisingera aquaemixtae]|uniref:LysR family transcriptional regulator n=1 Tax=Leisingera aquaemixtae TaxID=1396826 RepID=UPI003983F416